MLCVVIMWLFAKVFAKVNKTGRYVYVYIPLCLIGSSLCLLHDITVATQDVRVY